MTALLAWFTAMHVLQALTILASVNVVAAPLVAKVSKTSIFGKIVHTVCAFSPADVTKILEVWGTVGKALAVPVSCLALMLVGGAVSACAKAPANPPPAYVQAETSLHAAEKALAECGIATEIGSAVGKADAEAYVLVKDYLEAKKAEKAALAAAADAGLLSGDK